MTGSELHPLPFDAAGVRAWGAVDPRHRNWPVVYLLDDDRRVYVGESVDAEKRLRQHLASPARSDLARFRVILDETFNKSACLDLESFLIRMLSGEGWLGVMNLNAGVTGADYYDRSAYQKRFDEIFEELRSQRLFQRTLPEIVNSDLFKLSPFKALNHDQAVAVEDILEGLFSDLETGERSLSVVQGDPGTGKTVVGIYLMKLLQDIRNHDPAEPIEGDSLFSDFFAPGHAELLRGLRMALVVPQQSLRESIARVFALTPGLDRTLALTPFAVGESSEPFDLVIVDEAHRLSQRANQPSGPLNRKFIDITTRLFGEDSPQYTQLDWIRTQSRHTILLLDTGQTVRPADLPLTTTSAVLAEARAEGRLYPLRSQMRISAEKDYIGYIRAVLSDSPPADREDFGGYDLRHFSDLGELRRELRRREQEHGLARLSAGFAWPWSRKSGVADIVIADERLRWNSTAKDWINSPGAVDEVGSIHTLQGYDLNYAGVIIGPDLRWDESEQRIVFDRAHYFDKKGRENNPKLGITYSDEDLLAYVRNVYTVLLTRGIRGTYVYVCDEALRERLAQFF